MFRSINKAKTLSVRKTSTGLRIKGVGPEGDTIQGHMSGVLLKCSSRQAMTFIALIRSKIPVCVVGYLLYSCYNFLTF